MEEAYSVIVIILVIVSIITKLNKSAKKQAGSARTARNPAPEKSAAPKETGLDAFMNTLKSLGIDAPDITGISGEAPEADANQIPAEPAPIMPNVDPRPKPGHETHDPTEGSIELFKRSPEGKAVKQFAARQREPEPAARVPAFRVDARNLKNAVVMSEILGRPVALKRRG